MKTNQVAVCGVTLSLAVALYVVVRRSHLAKSQQKHVQVTTKTSADGKTTTTTTTTTTKKVVKANKTEPLAEGASYLHKDEPLEAARIASDQEFPDGSHVKVHGHGTGKVLHFIPQSKSYKVEIHDHDKVQQKTVPAIHISHIKVKDFFIYPIKSARGIRVDHAEITARGILNDRTWMMVDTKGTFITQRRYPKMALLTPQLDDLENPTSVTLTAQGMENLCVPIIREGAAHAKEVTTKVWRSEMVGIDQGDAAAEWLNNFLADVREDREFRLIRIKDSFKRAVNPTFAPDHETVFADGYPFLLTLDASLADVNDQLKEKITMDRFRPNIVLTGAPAFADEAWNAITIGGIQFRNVKPCDRCNIPTVDQEKGEAHPDREPQPTMTPFRNGATLGFKNASESSYYFGSNLVVEGAGRISVGAPVKILTLKEAVFA